MRRSKANPNPVAVIECPECPDIMVRTNIKGVYWCETCFTYRVVCVCECGEILGSEACRDHDPIDPRRRLGRNNECEICDDGTPSIGFEVSLEALDTCGGTHSGSSAGGWHEVCWHHAFSLPEDFETFNGDDWSYTSQIRLFDGRRIIAFLPSNIILGEN